MFGDWVTEAQSVMRKDVGDQEAWDEVKEGELPIKEVRAARKEEVTYGKQRDMGIEPNTRMLG